jgi:hypothetical protein
LKGMDRSTYLEPTLEELLSEEITQALMAADRVDGDALVAMLMEVASSRRHWVPLQPEPVDPCGTAVE